MDVAPILKINVGIPEVSSDGRTTPPKGNISLDNGVVSNDTESAIQIEDPVRRAEQTIGAFFEDENVPSGRFSIETDKDSGRFVYRLVDTDTGEVVKQFPGDYVLRRIAYYRELEGLSVDSQV